MPKDIQVRIIKKYGKEIGTRIIKDFYTYTTIDWSEASNRKINQEIDLIYQCIKNRNLNLNKE